MVRIPVPILLGADWILRFFHLSDLWIEIWRIFSSTAQGRTKIEKFMFALKVDRLTDMTGSLCKRCSSSLDRLIIQVKLPLENTFKGNECCSTSKQYPQCVESWNANQVVMSRTRSFTTWLVMAVAEVKDVKPRKTSLLPSLFSQLIWNQLIKELSKSCLLVHAAAISRTKLFMMRIGYW